MVRSAVLEEVVMRVVMPVALPDLIAQRKRTGADQWDEMWDGELHMAPAPNRYHQDFEWLLEAYLRLHWAPGSGGKVYHQINVTSIGGWPDDYRVPDLVLLLPPRFSIDKNEYFEGGPDVVVEIHSPGDEAYEKLPFYAGVGVSEVWIIHRDTKAPEIHLLRRGKYKEQAPQADGWSRSPITGLEMRVGRPGKLVLRLAGDEKTRQELPGA
jgi:Uma2 family endonuclease